MSIYVKYWQDCNNKCSFCNQRLGTKVNNFKDFLLPSKKSLINHSKLLEYFVFDEIIAKNLEPHSMKLMGGELFHRADIKELYEGFDYVIETLEKIRKEKTLDDINITVFSNLLYEDLSLIKHFINNSKHIKLRMKTSFDLDGRFKSNEQIKLFLKNLDELEKIREFSIKSVITKQTLNAFDENSYIWKIFKQLASRGNLFLDNFKRDNIDDPLYIEHFEITKDDHTNNIFNTIIENYDIISKDKRISEEKNLVYNNKKNIFILNNNINIIDDDRHALQCSNCQKYSSCILMYIKSNYCKDFIQKDF